MSNPNLLPLLDIAKVPSIRNGFNKDMQILDVHLDVENIVHFAGQYGGFAAEGLPAGALIHEIIAFTPTETQVQARSSSHGGKYNSAYGNSAQTLEAFDWAGATAQLALIGPDGQTDLFGGSSAQAALPVDSVLVPFVRGSVVAQTIHDNFIALKIDNAPVDANGNIVSPTKGEVCFRIVWSCFYHAGQKNERYLSAAQSGY